MLRVVSRLALSNLRYRYADMRTCKMWSKWTVWLVLMKLLVFQDLLSWCNARLLPVGGVDDDAGLSFNSVDDANSIPLTLDKADYELISDTYLGLYSHAHVTEDHVEVVYPVRVTRDGSFISHSVNADHDAIERAGARRKRAVGEEDPDSDELDGEKVIHYNITVGGRVLRLNLRPSHSFIGRALVVERHGPNGHTRQKPTKSASICHFQGNIMGQPESSVAVSACQGLAGMLRTEHGEYWVEPSLQHTPAAEGEKHPHVIYKRSALNPNKGMHKKNPEQRRKGINKNGRHRKRRRRRPKTCATKLPPRNVKTLEWTDGPEQLIIQRAKLNRRSRVNEIEVSQSLEDGDGEQGRGRDRRRGRRKGRQPRSISMPRHVEVLLVADSTMTDFHQKGNVETYLLTIMNMVSTLYLDPTIGNLINIVVVKIIVLDEQHAGSKLNITTNADTTLNNFCKWQRELNPDNDTHPNHHDVAILITRKDICAKQNVPCSTLGVAHVAGMCLPDRSCSVNEDNGITLAHTITHELGHNFGMYHDTQKIGCNRRIGTTLHVMTPVFEADTVDVAWSRCSQRDLTAFLDSGMGECLADSPAQVDYIYPKHPPGVLYDAARQCRLQFGVNVDEVCSELTEICHRLWCVVNDTCTTMLRPAAHGTSCGENMWCQNNECVERSSLPVPEDGGWGEWSKWSECSRSCGAGISIIKRQCNNPLPKNGGKYCTGERTRYKVCNHMPCPKSEPSFRQFQCSKYDNKTYDGKVIPKWLPYFEQDEPCELYCSTADESIIAPFGEYALDGTPCNLGTRDMCISGICRKVGCDWIVDSNATEDACGICNGNGDECKQVQGMYSKGATKESGYSEVAVIPAGSRNIKVEEVSNSKNYIGIGSARSRKFFLNGRKKITIAGEYLVAGTPALYERDRDWEKIKIPGPIKEDILIYQMIYRGKHRNPGVRYQYTVDKSPSEKSEAVYKWGTSEWTPCSVTCGQGIMRKRVMCYNNTGAEVDQEFCIINNEMQKPAEIMKVCHIMCDRSGQDHDTVHSWWAGPWNACPPCVKQPFFTPQRRRRVVCRDRNGNKMLPDWDCDLKSKPTVSTPCLNLPKCNSYYRY